MSTNNIGFYGEITKIISKLSSNTLLICSAAGKTETRLISYRSLESYSSEILDVTSVHCFFSWKWGLGPLNWEE